MPWQNYVVDVALEVNPETGIPYYHTVIVVVMRQQGKTELLLPVMTHRALGFENFGPQRILYTTQTGSKAREKWEDIHIARLEKSPFKDLFVKRLRLNQEAMIWVNGSFWMPGAGTGKTGGTGDSLDFGAIDEAWSADERRELGMRPAMLTRPSRQLWVCSMVPGLARANMDEGEYLRKKMSAGRFLVEEDVREGIAYFEFGANPELDPSDPATWHGCMPALCPDEDPTTPCRCDPNRQWRHTITVQSVRGDFQSMDLVDFCAEYLTIWPKDNRPTWTTFKEQNWKDLYDEWSQPARGVAIGVDMDDDRSRAYLATVGRRSDRHWHMEIAEPGTEISKDELGLEWVVPRIVDMCENNRDILAIVIDPRGPASSVILPLKNALREAFGEGTAIEVLTPNTIDISSACARLSDAVEGQGENPTRARHIGQTLLTNAVSYARKLISPKNRTFVWDRIGGPSSIAPLYAVTLGMHGYEAKMDDDYDVLDSVAGADGECTDCGKYPDELGNIEHYPDCKIAFPESAAESEDDA